MDASTGSGGTRWLRALLGLGQPQCGDSKNHNDEHRWPPWLSILFILVCSLAVWALVILGLWRLIGAD